MEFLEAHRLAIYIATVGLGAVLLSGWERRRPFVLGRTGDGGARHASHFVLLAVNQGVMLALAYVLARTLPADVALVDLGSSGVLPVLLGVLWIDLIEYARHRIMHTRWLWPVHQVHHSDANLDWSTELRFHPIEAAVTSLLRVAGFALVAIPGQSIALYAVVALPIGLLQHANVALPGSLERGLSKLVVTPSLHRVHHANDAACYNRNFAVVFIFWDHLFGSFRASRNERVFGVPDGAVRFKDLKSMLLSPLQRPSASLR